MVEYQYEPYFDPPEDYRDVDKRTCQLLGPTALVVQGLMGIIVVFTLVYKRSMEKPRRPWRIWTFDVSKQVAGQMFVHGLNLFISDTTADHTSGNPCVLYFLNILIDTTIGVGLIYVSLRTITYVLTEKLHLKGFQSGQYGDPPSFVYWSRQAAVYASALTLMKLVVVVLFVLWPGIFKIGAWLLTWTGSSDAAQVIFVMGVFPIIMNVLQFWLIDSIVKASSANVPPQLPVNSSTNVSEDVEPLFNIPDFEDEDDGSHGASYDIESQGRSGSLNYSRDSIPISPTEETKDIPGKGITPNHRTEPGQEAHSYPPNTSTSPTSVPSALASRRLSLSPRSGLLSLRRSPPLPEVLPLQAQSPLGPNSDAVPVATPKPTTALGSVLFNLQKGTQDNVEKASSR